VCVAAGNGCWALALKPCTPHHPTQCPNTQNAIATHTQVTPLDAPPKTVTVDRHGDMPETFPEAL